MSKETKKQLKHEIQLDNLVRELEKADNVLDLAEKQLRAQSEMNAALHCDTEVLYSNLCTRVTEARKDIKLALRHSKHKIAKKDTTKK